MMKHIFLIVWSAVAFCNGFATPKLATPLAYTVHPRKKINARTVPGGLASIRTTSVASNTIRSPLHSHYVHEDGNGSGRDVEKPNFRIFTIAALTIGFR